MQSAKTSKLPCRRRVHLYKSNIFKTIFEQIQKMHENDAKNDTKIINKLMLKT